MTEDRRASAEAFVGRNLLDAMLSELRTNDEAWSKLSKEKQDDTIDRLRARIQSSVRMALETLVAGDLPAVRAELSSVKFTAKGITCGIGIDRHSRGRHDLADYASEGSDVVVLMVDPEDYFAGMDDVQGEADQPGLFEEGLDTETGEIRDPEGEAAAPPYATAAEFADMASLIPRFAELGIKLPTDAETFPGTSSQIADLFVYADALEADLKPQLPEWLKPYIDDEAQERLNATDPTHTELAELVIALREQGVAASIKRCAYWTAEQRQDAWDWLEATESGKVPDDPEARADYERGAHLVEALAPPEPEPPAFNPGELAERLQAVGISVPGKVVSAWGDGEVEAVQRYIDEFSADSGPAELPECLEPYVQPGLAHQAGAGGPPNFDEWAMLRAEPAKLAERLRAHKIEVPDHEAYAWTAEERDEVIAYLRAVLAAAETGATLTQPKPAKLEPYLGTPAPEQPDPGAQGNGSGKATKKKTAKKKTKKKTGSKAKGTDNGASTEPPPEE